MFKVGCGGMTVSAGSETGNATGLEKVLSTNFDAKKSFTLSWTHPACHVKQIITLARKLGALQKTILLFFFWGVNKKGRLHLGLTETHVVQVLVLSLLSK